MVVPLQGGRLVAAVNTAYGDGVYEGSDGNAYGVDAGLLGAVTVLPGDDVTEFRRLGAIHAIPTPFTVSYDEDGTVTIGTIRIPTGDDAEDTEEQCSSCGTALSGWEGADQCSDCEDDLNGGDEEC